jgi:AraC-like DNA-binding protein
MAANESDRQQALLTELREQIARHAHAETGIQGVRLCAEDRSSEPQPSTSGTVLAVIVQGSKRLAIGDRVYEYGPGQYLIASVDLPVTGHFTRASREEPALGFGMTLRPSLVASLLLEAPTELGLTAGGRSVAPSGIGVADASADLLEAVLRMVRLVDSPGDRRILAASIEREIVWRLLTGPLADTARQIGRSGGRLTHIGRAARWITDNYNEQFRVEELARRFSMSPSAFHRNFHAVTALSPIQFQKQIRLQRSRLMLMTGAYDVATIGHRVGYDNTSQFSREYRRQFGLPPGRDAARLRAEDAHADAS